MPRPGTQTLVRQQRAVSGPPTDTGTVFVAGVAERGPTDRAVLVRNMADFELHFGERQSYSILWDWCEVAFREGATSIYVSRIVGPAAAVDTVTLNDAGAAASIAVDSVGEGAIGLTAQVIAGDAAGTFRLVIALDGVEVERSYDLADPAAAVAWASTSDYVRVRALGVNDPAVVGATALVGGSDDRAAITDTERAAALNVFTKGLGPGQVTVAGATTTAVHEALLVHARANNRFALLDGADTASDATLRAAADGIRASANIAAGDETYGMFFGNWLTVSGVVQNTTRQVPPSAVAAGIIARSDAESGNPNIAAAGSSGVSRTALGLVQADWTDAVREDLNADGVNTFKTVYGEVRLYGFRSLADPNDLDWNGWVQATAGRLRMAILNDAEIVGEQFLFDQIDGRKQKIAEFGGALRGTLLGYYTDGALYGETADEAYVVDVGGAVNTPATIADGQLRAVFGIRTSPFAELIYFELVKVPVAEAL